MLENTHNIYNQCEDFFGISDGPSATFGDGGDVDEAKTSQKSNKRGRGNSKQSLSEKKRVGKCNNGGSVPQSEEPDNPKRFSHSTRRKAKRRFDRTLLTIPDDEIDHPNIPFKDLIRLAEYNEGGEMPKKDGDGPGATPTDQSFSGDYHNDGFDTYDNVEEEVKEGENATPVVGASILNYQTFMEKTLTSRWSNQETALFYEGVRQFGTDISMIQQLFPNRTRRQVKLKYKKEGRRYPQRLDDALMYRSKDVFHFEQVIQRLQQSAENAVSENENVKDEEVGTEVNESAQQDASHGGRGGGVMETEESVRGEEVDGGGSLDMDDDFFFSQYRSD